MGFFDLFTGGGGLQRTIAKATNKDAQSQIRFEALEALRNDGSPEAILGLLKRFSFNYDKTIEDEQEKDWVHDTLVALAKGDGNGNAGEARATVMKAIEQTLLMADTLAWPLKVLAHVADHDQVWPILEKVFAANDNEYVRDPTKKIQLIAFTGEEFIDPRAAQALLPYLEDMDETVRFQAVESLVHQKNEEVAREPLLKLLVSPEEESRRVKIRILDGFSENGWNTHGYKGGVESLCEELGTGHSLDNKGRVKRPQRS